MVYIAKARESPGFAQYVVPSPVEARVPSDLEVVKSTLQE